MKRIILIITLITACQCNGWTPQNTETVVEVAQTLLQFVAQQLERADGVKANCDRYTVEDTEIRAKARYDCAQINGAKRYVLELLDVYDADPSKENEAELREAAEVLKEKLDESGLAR